MGTCHAARDTEKTGADDDAYAKRYKSEGAQHAFQTGAALILRLVQQRIDGFADE